MTDKRSILAIIIVMAIWITASTMDYNDDAESQARHLIAMLGGQAQ